MLLPTPRKEAEMSQQQSLFETGTAPWVVRLWDAIDPEKRQEVLAILAEMARDGLVALAPGSREGKNHES
jgi:TorA maturation chaperone TorD